MFGNNKKEDPSKSKTLPIATVSALNSLVDGTMVEGTIRCKNDIRVDGVIKGNLYCDAKVIIGPTGSIEGEIKCQNAIIEGKFQGIILIEDTLNVKETAVINGDVTTSKLMIQSGAIFNVTCKMSTGSKPAVRPKEELVVAKN